MQSTTWAYIQVLPLRRSTKINPSLVRRSVTLLFFGFTSICEEYKTAGQSISHFGQEAQNKLFSALRSVILSDFMMPVREVKRRLVPHTLAAKYFTCT